MVYPDNQIFSVESASSANPVILFSLQNFIIPYGTIHNATDGQTEVFFWDLAYHFTPDIALHLAKVKLNASGEVESIDFRERW